MRMFPAAAGVLLVSLSTLTAQNPIAQSPAASAVLEAFGLNKATEQVLELPQHGRRAFQFDVVIAGKRRTVDLFPHSMLAPDFKLLVDDGKSIRAIENPPECTYRGSVIGIANSEVAATLWNGRVSAFLSLGKESWFIEPVADRIKTASAKRHVVYRRADTTPVNAYCGGGKHPKEIAPLRGGNTTPASALQSCEIALDCDYRYYQANNNNTTTTRNAATTIMNSVDVIYRRDVEVCYTITTILVRTAATYRDGPDVGCVQTKNLLDEMARRWNANHTGIKRDLAHLFTAWGPRTGVVGCASLGVVCSQTNGYGVSRTIYNLSGNTGLVAHELGHNWSSGHCSGAACFIMCAGPGCGSALQFGQQSKNAILSHKATRTCLGRCGGCRNEADYTYFGQSCRGTGKGGGENCASSNWNQTFQYLSWNGNQRIAMPGRSGASALSVDSIELYCNTRSGTRNIQCWIYDGNATSGPGRALGTATMSVGTTLRSYKATFTTPVAVPANSTFYVVYDNPANNALNSPVSTRGTQTQAWFNQNGWFKFSAAIDYWNFRVNCTSNSARPIFTAKAAPRLGAAYQLEIQAARAGSLAVLFHAFGPQQVDLTAAGAAGCFLYVTLPSFDVTAAVTDGSGRATFNHAIPNLAGICGARFYQQVVIRDTAANGLGWVTTRRGQPLIGN